MIENYQNEIEIEEEVISEPAEQNFATVGTVYEDGVSLIFDGTSTASDKHYKVNASVVFTAGDRVKIIKDSGTYVVEYVVGNPKQDDTVEYAESAGSAETANEAKNVTEKINNILITDIFAPDGLAVQKASDVTQRINGKLLNTIFDSNGTTVLKAKETETASRLFQSASNYLELNASRNFIPNTTSGNFTIGNNTYWWYDGFFNALKFGGNSSYHILANASRELRPSSYNTYTPYSLGTSGAYWHNAYIGSLLAMIGNSASSKIGFFGKTAIARKTVATASTSATLAQVITKLNEVIQALKDYGLFG